MRIAISTRQVTDVLHGEIRDVLSQDWYRYLYSVSPEIYLLPLVNQPDMVESWASELDIDVAILSNGNDWGDCPGRDETERRLVAWCLERGKPTLGVCRGLQALNAIAGGIIEVDIQAVSGEYHGGTLHRVSLVSPNFSDLTGNKSIYVNSFHNQGVTIPGLASDFIPFAMSEAGIVEGFYHATMPVLAIQWHPERPGGPKEFNEELLLRFFNQGAFWVD